MGEESKTRRGILQRLQPGALVSGRGRWRLPQRVHSQARPSQRHAAFPSSIHFGFYRPVRTASGSEVIKNPLRSVTGKTQRKYQTYEDTLPLPLWAVNTAAIHP